MLPEDHAGDVSRMGRHGPVACLIRNERRQRLEPVLEARVIQGNRTIEEGDCDCWIPQGQSPKLAQPRKLVHHVDHPRNLQLIRISLLYHSADKRLFPSETRGLFRRLPAVMFRSKHVRSS